MALINAFKGYGRMVIVPLLLSVDTVASDILTYNMNGYLPDKNYCFFITALDEEVSVSVSNSQCTRTGSELPPEWIELSALRVEKRQLSISGAYDTNGEIIEFKSEKKNGLAGSWTEVASGTGESGMVSFNDSNADTTVVNLYRISAINNCGISVITSEPVRNMVLSSEREGKNVTLRWNNPFPGKEAGFSILRNTGSGFNEVVTGYNDTVYIDDYSSYSPSVTTGEIFYQISAVRHDSPAGTAGSLSSTTTIHSIENIYAANAFTFRVQR